MRRKQTVLHTAAVGLLTVCMALSLVSCPQNGGGVSNPGSSVNSGSTSDSGNSGTNGGGGGSTTEPTDPTDPGEGGGTTPSGPVANDPTTWGVEGGTLSVPSGANVTAEAISKAQDANEDSNITAIKFEGNVTIGDNAFQGSSISSVTGWENVTSIGDNAFENCTGITGNLNLSSATSIGQGAFKGTGITSVTFAASVNIAAGSLDFYDDKSTGAFAHCTSLTSVIFEGQADIGKNTFYGSGLKSVTFNGAVTVGEEAFYNSGQGCESLESVTFGGSPTTVEGSAFLGCTALTDVTGWENVTSIGNSAFSVTGLTSVKLGAGLTKLEANAFNRCTSLTSVDLSACTRLTNETTETNCTIGNYAFQILDYEAPNRESVNLALKLPDNASGWTVGTDAFSNRNVTLYYNGPENNDEILSKFQDKGATSVTVCPASTFPPASTGSQSLMSSFSTFRDLLF